jgi:hypothetical protein
MASLAGVPIPETQILDGVDISGSLAAQQGAHLRSYALSVYPRCPGDLANSSLYWKSNDCLYVERATFPFMGISLRVDGWRYVEWRRWDGEQQLPVGNASGLLAAELYNHTADTSLSFDDASEVKNLAGMSSCASIQAALAQQLHEVYPAWA